MHLSYLWNLSVVVVCKCGSKRQMYSSFIYFLNFDLLIINSVEPEDSFRPSYEECRNIPKRNLILSEVENSLTMPLQETDIKQTTEQKT